MRVERITSVEHTAYLISGGGGDCLYFNGTQEQVDALAEALADCWIHQRWLTIREVAAHLSVSVKWLERERHRVPLRTGYLQLSDRLIRYGPDDIETLRELSHRGPKPPAPRQGASALAAARATKAQHQRVTADARRVLAPHQEDPGETGAATRSRGSTS